MPELPEVEVTVKGIMQHFLGKKILKVVLSGHKLRYPIPNLSSILPGQKIITINRRGKYIVMQLNHGFLLVHLGMSGKFLANTDSISLQKHEHARFYFQNNKMLSYFDQRRFGLILWIQNQISEHKLLKNLGIEPLTIEFDENYLFNLLKDKKTAIKSTIMNSNLIVGVGNIYASEALFRAKIAPLSQADSISQRKCRDLCKSIKDILCEAINHGGTTIKDFQDHQGGIGYFKQKLAVYGRAGEKCIICTKPIKNVKICGRSSFYCQYCQQ